jgi:ribosome-binding ATPase YchF (GTP1/OBG family)
MIIGLCGKPSAGKSTFFKAATLADVLIANYPFATITANEGVGHVKIKQGSLEFGKHDNPREGWVAGDFRFVPTKLLDVAGLVEGASEGKGMGNSFLDDLRQADVLIHVIDVSGSTNAEGEPVEALSHDPVNDVTFLEREIDLWYLGILKKGWEKFSKTVRQTQGKISEALAKQLSGLSVTDNHVADAIMLLKLPDEFVEWSEAQLEALAIQLRKYTKPMVIAANKADIPGAMANVEKLKEAFPEATIIPCSAESELALREATKLNLIDYIPGEKSFSITEKGESALNDAQKKGLQFIKDNVLSFPEGTGVQAVLNHAVFDKLRYIAIFPGGSKLEDSKGNTLPDCFLMPPGTTALDFAYRLHTDFGKNFIKAMDIRKKLPIGRDHALIHRDIVEIFAK